MAGTSSRALVDDDAPEQRVRGEDFAQAALAQHRFDTCGRMGIDPERAEAQPVVGVLGHREAAPEAAAARVDCAVIAPGQRRRGAHQRGHVGVAADHAVERDDVGARESRGELHEIADVQLDAFAEAPSVRLASGGLHERRRGVDAHCPRGASVEQRVLNGPYTAPDVEHVETVHPQPGQRVDQHARIGGGAAGGVTRAHLLGARRGELALEAGTSRAAHGASIRREVPTALAYTVHRHGKQRQRSVTYAEAVYFATGLLYLERRVTFRRLAREFGLDEETIEHVRHELTLGRRVAREEGGEVLVWALDAEPQIAEAEAGPRAHAEAVAERRQLTVMFCDLVGSTALSTHLDPEDLRDVIGAFQDLCREAIARYEGFIARYMGDGLLVYFGYPQATEQDAERAAFAGLDILAAMPGLNVAAGARHGVELAVRIGVATGPVVVGDIVGEGAAEEAAVHGETPNLAARLQGVAEPGQLVVGDLTRRLLAGRFEIEDIGRHALKGIADPVQAWRVRGASDPGATDEERVPAPVTLVGRDAELELLTRAWESSRERRGQVVLVQGEAGLGKSRLVDALRAHAAREDLVWVAIRCSPYHGNSAFYPVVEHLRRALGWQPGDDAATRLARLEEALAKQSLPLAEAVPLFADLLSLPLGDAPYPPLGLSPGKQREATLDALTTWLLDEAERRPVMQVWEDVHWADASTLELLALHVAQSPTAAILNVVTYRPEFTPPWPLRSHILPITLNRLERDEVRALIASRVDRQLPAEVVEHIVARADGVPLYVEELTRAILESGCLDPAGECYVLNREFDQLVIPATLKDSLMARLDRVPDAREVAQLGSVIGREFAYDILQPLSELDEAVLRTGLEHLVGNELLYQRGRPPRSRYQFKHALIQDAAYQSLLKRSRQQHHRRLAALLESRFAADVEAHPELLVHHLAEAGEHEAATGWWRKAGERAVAQSANLEAIGHFSSALRALQHLPEGVERERLELRLQLALGSAQLVARGHGATQVQVAYRRAHELCKSLGETQQLLATLVGLWRFSIVGQHLSEATALAGEIEAVARGADDPVARVMADYTAGYTEFSRGRLAQAGARLTSSRDRYSPEHRALSPVYAAGQDPGVASWAYLALLDWLLGSPARSREDHDQALALAEALDDDVSRCHALAFGAIALELAGDLERSAAVAERGAAIGSEKGFQAFTAFNEASGAWAAFARSPSGAALEALRGRVAASAAIGLSVMLPYYRTLIARAEAQLGQTQAALRTLDAAQSIAEQRDERWWDAEIARLRGEYLLAADPAGAERELQQALDTARAQGALALELRAASLLATVWHGAGDSARALALLGQVLEKYPPGEQGPDLAHARKALARWAAAQSA